MSADIAQLDIGDSLVSPLLGSLLTCLCGELAKAGVPVCFCCRYHGASPQPAVACDCECEAGPDEHARGQAWIRLVSADTMPVAGTSQFAGGGACNIFDWRLTIELGIYRCVPVTEGPDCPAQTQSALEADTDFAVMRTVLTCCPALEDHSVRVVGWQPIGPMGGCVGQSLTFTVWG